MRSMQHVNLTKFWFMSIKRSFIFIIDSICALEWSIDVASNKYQQKYMKQSFWTSFSNLIFFTRQLFTFNMSFSWKRSKKKFYLFNWMLPSIKNRLSSIRTLLYSVYATIRYQFVYTVYITFRTVKDS